MRYRKQGQNETFSDYKNVIYKMAESLHTPLRPRIRQQLLYVPINSVAQLRKLCLKGENLLNEVSKINSPPHSYTRNTGTRRIVNELRNDCQDEASTEITTEINIDELAKRSNGTLTCWNCKEKGHRYIDCMEVRTILCYGCGIPGAYKPTCPNCSPGNSKVSEGGNYNLRKDHNL